VERVLEFALKSGYNKGINLIIMLIKKSNTPFFIYNHGYQRINYPGSQDVFDKNQFPDYYI
jgi:hypothetical protein